MVELKGFGKAAWSFISFIYESGWNSIPINDCNISFRNTVTNKLTPKLAKPTIDRSSKGLKDKEAEIAKLSPLIPVHLPKKVLEKSKFFGKDNNSKKTANSNIRKSYAQATGSNVSEILKLKDNFPNLPIKKIEDIQRIINNQDKVKPHLNMTTKGLSRKQVIIPMSKVNVNNILALANEHVTNINRALKNVKLNVMVDFICPDNLGITIISNLVVSQLDL